MTNKLLILNIQAFIVFTFLWGGMGLTEAGYWNWQVAIAAGLATTAAMNVIALVRFL